MGDNAYARSERAALALHDLLIEAGRNLPDGLDIDGLTTGDSFWNPDAALTAHVLAGESHPSSSHHSELAVRIADQIGSRRTFAAIVAACESTTFRTPGNLGRELLDSGRAGTPAEMLDWLSDTCPHDIAIEFVLGSRWSLAVHDVCRLAHRLGCAAPWLITAIDRMGGPNVSDRAVVEEILALDWDLPSLLRHTTNWGTWLDIELARELLATGDVARAAIAVAGASAYFTPSDRDALADCPDVAGMLDVAVAGLWRPYRDTAWQHDRPFCTVARRLLASLDADLLVRLPKGCLHDVLLVDPAATAAFYADAAVDTVARVVRTENYLAADYLRRPDVSLDVVELLVRAGDVDAAAVLGIPTLFADPGHAARLLDVVPGVVPVFVGTIADETAAGGSNLGWFAVLLDDLFKSRTAGLDGGLARLWHAVIEQRSKSPAADRRLTATAMCSKYVRRWSEQQARLAASV